MQLGLCTLSKTDSPVESVVRIAGEMGYDGVEIWGKDHVGSGRNDICRSIRDVAQQYDLEIPVYGSYLRAGSPGFDGEFEHELDVADRLDADLIRVWAGNQEFGDHDDVHWERVVDDLRTLTDRARDRGLGVTVEKHANTLTNTTEGASRLIAAVGRPRCRLNWQPAFSLPADEILDDAEALVDIANNVHIQAVSERDTLDRCPLEDAYFDVADVIGVFEEGRFDGFVNVEFVADDRAYEEAIAADLEYLRSASGRSRR